MKFLCTCQQIFRGDEALVFFVNIFKDSFNVFYSVILIWFLGHEFDELFEADLTSIIGIKYWHRDVNKSSSGFVSTLSQIFSQVKWSQHAIMIFVKEIKDLLEDFNVSDWALCDNKLFGIEVDIFSDFGEAASLSALCFGTFLDTVIISKAFSMASAEFAERSAHSKYW